jgi:Family of unknown function (DUF5681)
MTATRFKPGRSGNPAGRNRTTLAVEALLDAEAETLTRKAIELAKAGDLAALRVCLDRIAPPRKDRPVLFELPPVSSAADAAKAAASTIPIVFTTGGAGQKAAWSLYSARSGRRLWLPMPLNSATRHVLGP